MLEAIASAKECMERLFFGKGKRAIASLIKYTLSSVYSWLPTYHAIHFRK